MEDAKKAMHIHVASCGIESHDAAVKTDITLLNCYTKA